MVTASPTAWTYTVPAAGGAGRRVRGGGGTPVLLPFGLPIVPGGRTGLPPEKSRDPSRPERCRRRSHTREGARMAAELAACVDVEARMAAALVELERHPGHLTLAAGTCTGVTAQRWAAASATLSALWEDFATYRSVLDDARARPAERPRCLRELDAIAAGMDTALREVAAVVTAYDTTHRAVFTALAPLADRVRDALTTARELDPDGTATARLAGALAAV